MSNVFIEDIKARLEAIEKERELLRSLITIYEGQPTENNNTKIQYKTTPTSFSIAGRVVDSVIELIQVKARQVNSKEVFEYLEEKGVSLGDTKNKNASLAAILSAETKKRSGRLRRVTRGVFDIKK